MSKRSKKIEKISPRGFNRDLNKILDVLFIEIDDAGMSDNQAAKKAKLAASTVSHLRYRRTKFPHFLTVWKLAKAMGYEIDVQIIRGKQRGRLRRAA